MKILLKVYKNTLSLLLENLFGKACRYTPTCSEYAVIAIEKHGIFKGTLISFKRFLKCNPFGGQGEDLVPLK